MFLCKKTLLNSLNKTSVSRSLGRTQHEVSVKLVSSVEEAKRATEELMAASAVGFDAEGAELSRFGKLALLQFRTINSVIVCDALVPGIVDALRPVFISEDVVKIVHDCREDGAALCGQFGIRMKNVFDTQAAAFGLMQGQENRFQQQHRQREQHGQHRQQHGERLGDSDMTSSQSQYAVQPGAPAFLPSLEAVKNFVKGKYSLRIEEGIDTDGSGSSATVFSRDFFQLTTTDSSLGATTSSPSSSSPSSPSPSSSSPPSSPLSESDSSKSSVKELMAEDADIWLRRPVSTRLLKYAVSDVLDLLRIHKRLDALLTEGRLEELRLTATASSVQNSSSSNQSCGDLVSEITRNFLDYGKMNMHVKHPSQLKRAGLKLRALLTAQTPSSLVFKLNAGKLGLVAGCAEVQHFRDIRIGQIVDCYVSGWSDSDTAVYLQRF